MTCAPPTTWGRVTDNVLVAPVLHPGRFDEWVGNIGASNAAAMIKAARLKALKAGKCGAPDGYTFNPDTGD